METPSEIIATRAKLLREGSLSLAANERRRTEQGVKALICAEEEDQSLLAESRKTGDWSVPSG